MDAQETAPARSDAAASDSGPPPAPSAPSGATPGVLTDVPFEKSVFRRGRDIGVVIGLILVAVLAVGLLTGARGFSTAAWWLAFGLVLVGLLCFGYGRQRRARSRARALAAAANQSDLVPTVTEVLNAVRGSAPFAGITELLKVLVEQGRSGLTLRIARPKEAAALEPWTYPFEPQPLNEALSSLVQEQAGSAADTQRPTASASRFSRRPSRPARLVRRNIILKGGWIVLAVFGFNWVMGAMEAIARRRVTWQLLYWSAFLVILLFLPAARQFNQQWFVVPGGIALRKAGWLQSQWSVHLFQRGHSVLCVCHHSRQRWVAVVADGECSGRTIGTKPEIDFLLRAWLSSVPPPPADRLSDLQ